MIVDCLKNVHEDVECKVLGGEIQSKEQLLFVATRGW